MELCFPEFPSMYSSIMAGYKRGSCGILGEQKWSSSHFALHLLIHFVWSSAWTQLFLFSFIVYLLQLLAQVCVQCCDKEPQLLQDTCIAKVRDNETFLKFQSTPVSSSSCLWVPVCSYSLHLKLVFPSFFSCGLQAQVSGLKVASSLTKSGLWAPTFKVKSL